MHVAGHTGCKVQAATAAKSEQVAKNEKIEQSKGGFAKALNSILDPAVLSAAKKENADKNRT